MQHYKSMAVAFSVVLALYALSVLIEPGWVTYLLSLPAMLIVALTALARVNDITLEKTGRNWQLRRLGFCMAGTAAVMLAGGPLTSSEPMSWRSVFTYWGVALVWLTTPNMPPWWRYVSGEYKAPDLRTAIREFFAHLWKREKGD